MKETQCTDLGEERRKKEREKERKKERKEKKRKEKKASRVREIRSNLTAVLNGVVKVGLVEVTFEQRLKGGRETAMQVSGRRAF